MKKIDQTQHITKDYFEKSITALLQGIRREITFALEGTEERIGRQISEANDKSLKKLDGIAKELEEMREDRIIGSSQTRMLRKDVDSHEERLVTLERAVKAS